MTEIEEERRRVRLADIARRLKLLPNHVLRSVEGEIAEQEDRLAMHRKLTEESETISSLVSENIKLEGRVKDLKEALREAITRVRDQYLEDRLGERAEKAADVLVADLMVVLDEDRG